MHEACSLLYTSGTPSSAQGTSSPGAVSLTTSPDAMAGQKCKLIIVDCIIMSLYDFFAACR